MDRLVEELKKIAKQCPLESDYNWEIPANVPIQIPLEISDTYHRNIYLKENLKKELKSDANLGIHYWVIQGWGGIRTFKKTPENSDRICEFLSHLEKGNLRKSEFSVISSLSKIASFIAPEKYAIYDSRSIYALNWLIFLYSDEKLLFPQPTGRSAKLAEFDMGTIFRLSGYTYKYREYKTAYFEYCTLLTYLSKKVYSEDRPYKMEMLLFLVAPSAIVKSIKSSVSLSIKQVGDWDCNEK